MDTARNIKIGDIVRRTLREQGKTNSWFAEELSINIRTVNKILKKETIDTQQLFKISKILQTDFFKIYSEALKEKILM